MRRWLPQVLRRATQLGVLVFVIYASMGGAWRNYKVAHNHRRLVSLMEGPAWAAAYGLNEDALSLLGEPYAASLGFLGMPWAGRMLGVDSADPLLVSANAVRTRSLPGAGLLFGLLTPLALAVLLGKVFCSHLCPARLLFELGQVVRKGLRRLGVPVVDIGHTAPRLGGWVLVGGLAATALSSTAVWLLILPYVALTAGIFLAITAGVLSGLFIVIGFWLVIDIGVAPGFFCHHVCPTGFVLEQLGRRPALRLAGDCDTDCLAGCHACQRVCPYGLSPRDETHRPACDNCGRCAVACPAKRLSRRLTLPLVAGVLLLCMPASALAHHNKGLPHYGYFENYPQVPTDEYVAIVGKWEIGATIFNFQGLDRRNADTPNDVKIYLYLYDLKKDRAYRGPLDVELFVDGKRVARFERPKVDEEAVYSTRETLPTSGEYTLYAVVEGTRVPLRFYVDLAGDGVNWAIVGGIGTPVLILFALAVVGRRRRRKSSTTRRAPPMPLKDPA